MRKVRNIFAVDIHRYTEAASIHWINIQEFSIYLDEATQVIDSVWHLRIEDKL